MHANSLKVLQVGWRHYYLSELLEIHTKMRCGDAAPESSPSKLYRQKQ